MDLLKAEKTLSELEKNSVKVAEVTKSIENFSYTPYLIWLKFINSLF